MSYKCLRFQTSVYISPIDLEVTISCFKIIRIHYEFVDRIDNSVPSGHCLTLRGVWHHEVEGITRWPSDSKQ